jgi:transcriptional regulator of aroF, aroG, tyrA and aromatic amino acid transport
MDTRCFCLPNADRIGLVKDISHLLVNDQINIVSMEVQPNTLYLEFEALAEDKENYILERLENIPDIVAVNAIKLMPHQQNLEQLKAILASVSDGIIAIDDKQRITQYNPAAEKIVRIPAQKVIGQLLSEIFPPDIPLMDSLKYGTTYDNREIILENTQSHYLTSGRPIKDGLGRIIGAVAILKDINDVRKLVDSFTGSHQQVFHEIIYRSKAIQKVVKTIKSIATGDSTVMIRGETGTGKELVARAIHATSLRAQNKFVPLNCAAIPETLLESELFGYQGGAFTGADKNGKLGLFEFANGGTLFLDEISEISVTLQAKLLRVLQEGTLRKVGSAGEIPINVRILAATNRNLEEMITEGLFREDLYYRLNVIPLFIPPLRDRREDIPLLVQSFSQRFSVRLHKTVSTISETAMTKLTQYDWPGNIRELENVIERAVNLISSSTILTKHIYFDYEYSPQPEPSGPAHDKSTIAEVAAQAECEALTNALRRYHTSRSVGKALGLSHTSVLRKMKKYGLQFFTNTS